MSNFDNTLNSECIKTAESAKDTKDTKDTKERGMICFRGQESNL